MLKKNFPGRKAAHRIDAQTRAEEAKARTPAQQLERLDRRLGEGIGAVSERAKLQASIEEATKATETHREEKKKKKKSRKSQNKKNKE